MTQDDVIRELDIQPPREVAWTSKSGRLMDDEGDRIDERETVPYTWALGPYGSWVVTVEDATVTIREHDTWEEGRSFRLGRVATWKPGWGFALRENT